jgi:hypothetical protein
LNTFSILLGDETCAREDSVGLVTAGVAGVSAQKFVEMFNGEFWFT